jgi:ribose 5-phosphate isomerase B
MARRAVISEQKVRDAHRSGQGFVVVPDKALITPLARDAARDLGVEFRSASEHPDAPPPPPSGPRAVAIGSDHGGFALKTELIPFVEQLGWSVHDVGTHSDAACDYPDFAYSTARMVADGRARLGIMIDGAGLGSAMVCNKVYRIRAASPYNEFTAWNARAHNDANVVTLGSRTLGIEICKAIVRVFLETDFEGGRHAKRVGKIADVDEAYRGKT